KHRRAHLAGECALLLVVTVLRKELDGGPLQDLLHRRQRRERRRDRDLGLGRHLLLQLPHELHRLGGGLVHLPVSADELATRHSSSTLIPGSSRPSRNSSEAPPPVETWVTLSASPISAIAAAESPPPTTVRVPRFGASATAPATARGPGANSDTSKSRIRPLHKLVFARTTLCR